MADLNNLEEIKKLDPKDVYGSTGLFTKQCEQIWSQAKITVPDDYKKIDTIILCGMGGSAYGGYVTQTLYKNHSKVAIYSNNDYHIPAFANDRSLIVLSSYSGSTEEVLSCATEAEQKGLKTMVLTGGGKLAETMKGKNLPGIVFDPVNNPSGQPRLGTGYMVVGFIAILNALGIVSISDEEMQKTIDEVKTNHEQTVAAAKELAQSLNGLIPVIIGSEFLFGNAHILRNQTNETAKSFSAFEDIPELNHHLMEGLKNPQDKKIAFLFLDSDLYESVIQKRTKLTKDVVTKNNVEHFSYKALGTSPLTQVLNLLSFGGYFTFYLAILYGQDPSVIPWVDYFKEQLTK